jgi:hypothetical protein
MSGSALARAVRRQALLRIHPHVYAIGDRVLPIRGRLLAAILYAGPEAALSHTTAGWWWGILGPVPRVIHLSAATVRARGRGLRVHHPRTIERTVHRRLPVTPVSRTLLDLAATVKFAELRRAVAETDHRGLLVRRAAFAVLGRGRPGSSALRKALDLHLPELAATASFLEERFLALLQEHGVPMPEINVRVGPFKVDAVWSAERVVVELDGHATHAQPARAEADRQRDLELRARGFTVRRYTWQQVTRTPDAVVADLRLARSGAVTE